MSMKKIIAICMFIFACSAAQAQFMFGPQFGFSYATLTNTSDLTVTAKPVWHAGFLFDLGLGKHFSLQPSLLYSKRGFKYDYETNTVSSIQSSTDTTITTTNSLIANVDAKLGYIDIPVLLNIYFGDHRGFMLGIGPQLSILLSNKTLSTTTVSATSSINGGTPQTSKPETETDTKFDFNPTDISLMAGIGYKLPKLLLVYLRASTGFAEVQKNKTVLKEGNEGRNFTFQVGAALTFGAK